MNQIAEKMTEKGKRTERLTVLLWTRNPLDILVSLVYQYVRCTSLFHHVDYEWVVRPHRRHQNVLSCFSGFIKHSTLWFRIE